jgi:lipopolysaccharide/colanic/teichoic acid biosynthesis glycosyltransferase
VIIKRIFDFVFSLGGLIILSPLFLLLAIWIKIDSPGPEVPRYMAQYPEDIRKLVLSVPPGITDIAAIKFKNENEMLKNAQDPGKDLLKNSYSGN